MREGSTYARVDQSSLDEEQPVVQVEFSLHLFCSHNAWHADLEKGQLLLIDIYLHRIITLTGIFRRCLALFLVTFQGELSVTRKRHIWLLIQFLLQFAIEWIPREALRVWYDWNG